MKNVRDLPYTTMMTTILIILGFILVIPLGSIPVPIVLQNLGIMLAGVLLGWRKGCLPILLFFPLRVFIPAFSGSTLFAVFAGPTVGYVVAWFFVPVLTNVILKIFKTSSFINNLIAILLGDVLFVDVMGAIYLPVYIHTSLLTSLLSNLVFIPGDTIKAIIASVVAYEFEDKLMVSQEIVFKKCYNVSKHYQRRILRWNSQRLVAGEFTHIRTVERSLVSL